MIRSTALFPFVVAAIASGTVRADLVTYTFTFDNALAGTAANALPQPPGLGAGFFNGAYLPDIDPGTGLAIPGSEHWQIDAGAPSVVTVDPTLYGRPPAPSPLNAMDALFQPVLITFTQPLNLEPVGFSVTLANGAFGINGTLPGNEDTSLQFFDSTSHLLGRVPVNQTAQGSMPTGGGWSGVSYVLIPGGAFYDNLYISGTPVPAPGSLVLLGLAGLIAGHRRRD